MVINPKPHKIAGSAHRSTRTNFKVKNMNFYQRRQSFEILGRIILHLPEGVSEMAAKGYFYNDCTKKVELDPEYSSE